MRKFESNKKEHQSEFITKKITLTGDEAYFPNAFFLTLLVYIDVYSFTADIAYQQNDTHNIKILFFRVFHYLYKKSHIKVVHLNHIYDV
jgi:hypothetical protein